MELGYKLSSEEHGPESLTTYAREAEITGFEHAMISDHFHPWTEQQGSSPFVWSTLGGIAEVTEDIHVGTAVTCPTMRIHPAIIAQASATIAKMMPDRFSLNVGTGERLNEHILGDNWPPHKIRVEMLEEAVDLIRRLWEGEQTTYNGVHYNVHNAKIYTLPEENPPINMAASGPRAARLAGRAGDGLVSTAPKEEIVDLFEKGRSREDRPKYAEITVCYAKSEDEALNTAKSQWPNGALSGELGQQLSMPAHFEQAAEMVSDEDIKKHYVLGPDPQDFVDQIKQYQEAGFNRVILHQIGSQQEEFMQFARDNLLGSF